MLTTASYDVSLTVPSGWVVGATGREQSRTDNRDGTTTHRYVQADVHDFAWTTSPDFVDMSASCRRAEDASGVDVRLLLQPEHRNQADRHFDAAALALSRFSEWFGPYPHGHLTIVDPVAIVNRERKAGQPPAWSTRRSSRPARVGRCRGGSTIPRRS